MALLTDAIRASDRQMARRRVDAGVVEVERITGREQPYNEESYAVRLRRADGSTQDLHDAEDLIEALAYLSGFSGVAPEDTGWEPVIE